MADTLTEHEQVDRALTFLREEAGLVLSGRLGAAVRERLSAQLRAVPALADSLRLERLLEAVCAPPEPLFADIELWRTVRTDLVPLLRTYPSISAWVCCAGGGDAASLAIVLSEEGLLARIRIYATDLAEAVVSTAATLSLRHEEIAAAAERHLAAGGREPLASHLQAQGDVMVLAPKLRERMVFGVHNPATDGALNEFQLVICRDVLGALDPALEARAFRLLYDSVCRLGLLAIGSTDQVPESLRPYFETYKESPPVLRRMR